MEDKIKTEEFNSTEIKIEEIKESDRPDDWDVLSELKSDTYSLPYMSVPKMRDCGEESDSISYGASMESDKQDNQGIFSLHGQESERKVEEDGQDKFSHKQQENEKVRKMDGTMQHKSPQHEQENEKVRREIDEAMEDKLFQHEQENEKVRREIDEAMEDKLFQLEEENEKVRREIAQAMQNRLFQLGQENEKLRREIEEAMQDISLKHEKKQESEKVREIGETLENKSQYEQENERVKREVDEAIHDRTPVQPKQEQGNESFASHGQHSVPIKCSVAMLTDQPDKRIYQEVNEAKQDNTCKQSAALCSKSKIQCEPLAKAKDESGDKLVHLEFREAFLQFFNVNSRVPDNVSAESAEVDELEREKNLHMKICSKGSVLFRNEERDSPSSDKEENKELDEFK